MTIIDNNWLNLNMSNINDVPYIILITVNELKNKNFDIESFLIK